MNLYQYLIEGVTPEGAVAASALNNTKVPLVKIEEILSIYLSQDMHESEKRDTIFKNYEAAEIEATKAVLDALYHGRPQEFAYSYSELNELHTFLHEKAEHGISDYPSLFGQEDDAWMHNNDCGGYNEDGGKCLPESSEDISAEDANSYINIANEWEACSICI